MSYVGRSSQYLTLFLPCYWDTTQLLYLYQGNNILSYLFKASAVWIY